MKPEITSLVAYLAQFKDPKVLVHTLITNVLANLQYIVADVTQAVTDFNAQQDEKAGEDIADLLIKALGPVQGVSYPERHPEIHPENLTVFKW